MTRTAAMTSRPRGPIALLLVAAIAAIPLVSQTPSPTQQSAGAIPGNAPELATHDEPATFRTGVNLVLVPVVARDRDGRSIGSLHKEDFQLFDKNKPQMITRFSMETLAHPVVAEVNATPENDPAPADPSKPLPPLPDRFIVYLFDDMHLSISDLAQARAAAKRQLSQSLTASTRIAIYTTSGRTRQEFTNDRDLLDTTMDHIQPWTSPMRSGLPECPDIEFYQADMIFNRNDTQALAAAVSEYLGCNPPPPGSDPSAARAEAEAVSRTTAQRVVDAGEYENQVAFSVMEDIVRRLAAVPGSRNIILISGGFIVTTNYRLTEGELMNRAIRANVTINALDARGLYVVVPGGDASTPVANPGTMQGLKSQYQLSGATANEDVLAELADATAGFFFRHNNGLAEGFEKLTKQPEYVYVLGFSPQNLKNDGSYHSLKVVVKNPPGLALQVRRGYYAPLHAKDPTEDAKEEVREALFSREEQKDIPVDLNLQFFKSSEVNAKLAVIARVDLRPLHFRKADGRNLDNLTIVAGLFDGNGNFISGTEKTVEMKLRDQTLAALPASGISVKSNFDLMPGDYSVRLVVRDTEGQMMTARNGAVRIP
jgi:VWFA-related protein